MAIGVIHGREAVTKLVLIGASKRVQVGHGRQRDVVANEHDLADSEVWLQSAGRVGQDQCADAQTMHYTHRKRWGLICLCTKEETPSAVTAYLVHGSVRSI